MDRVVVGGLVLPRTWFEAALPGGNAAYLIHEYVCA